MTAVNGIFHNIGNGAKPAGAVPCHPIIVSVNVHQLR